MKKAFYHFLFWIAFFLFWQQVVYFYINNPLNRFVFTAFDVLLITLVFYPVFYFIGPQQFKDKKIFVGLMLLTVIVGGALSAVIMNLFLQYDIITVQFSFRWNYADLVNNRFFIASIGVSAGLAAKLSINWFSLKREKEILDKERISSELMYLKAQINPHFLFNAINTIYIQMDVAREEAKETLNTFSEMLRYQLYECSTEKVPIEKEVEYLKNYVNMQRLRKDERYHINFQWHESLSGFSIAPFILIPLIENMFKHVSNENHGNVIEGSVEQKNNRLIFQGKNSSSDSTKGEILGGVGLRNVRRRLELLYPSKHLLKITNSKISFEVWLEIHLH